MKRSMGAAAVLSAICVLGCGGKTEPAPQPGSEPKPAAAAPAPLTIGNLKAARQEEADAKARYEALAAKADEEGFRTAAALWRAAASSIGLSLAKHEADLKALGAGGGAVLVHKPLVASTRENLEATVKDKAAALAALSDRIKAAEEEKQEKAAMSFKGRRAADEQYLKLFTGAAAGPDGWKAGDREFLVCQVCSYVSTDVNLKQCPICSAPREKFVAFK